MSEKIQLLKWNPMLAVLCLGSLGRGRDTRGLHQTAAFLIFKCLVCKNKEAGVEFGRVPVSSGNTYHPRFTSWENSKSHHNCIHLSSQAVCMDEVLGLFLPTFSCGQKSQLGCYPPLGMGLLGQACRISPQD